ncbi:protein CHROMATIN REMODELING 19 isoform X3 [Citrus clementina]|uniref:protein CHROMATIN REMODELING 19 isoform X3 n=1 Tax=Citrus clementina TaxID=85681 RepID=UPI000CED04F7|nr:protein CHROMATIN REMODELING 19 isoform X3 [Citrus x clementina]
MKREYAEISEISDEEWEPHSESFKPSRVLKINTRSPKPKPKPKPPPPIESFAYNKDENLEDDDVEEVVGPTAATNNRGRRFIVDDDEEEEEEEEGEEEQEQEHGDFVEVYDIKSSSQEEEEEELLILEDEIENDDVVGKALQKCAKISAELKRELYGTTTSAACDRYAEVEASSVRIVTQSDIDDACGDEDSDFQPVLKPYQLVGVNFLLLLYRKGIAGAILADEMGLGKTIQYHGAGRTAYSRELSSLAKAGLPPPFNVLLVCYSLFERHSVQQKDDRKILKRWRWSCVLMDEAHALKDKNSYRWKNLMSVARNANQRLMLTGTPLQNDLHELWSLLEFMMPDLFATEDVDLKKLLNGEDRDLIGRMKSILGPFILRRLKSDVMQQLVPKIQRVEYVTMERPQEDAYRVAIEEYRAVSRARIAKLSDADLATIVGVLPQRQISNYFVQFRKIANHPLLVRRIYSDDDVVRFAKKLHPMGAFGFECTLERVIEELKNYSDFSIHQLLRSYGGADTRGILSEEHVMLSAKCRVLSKLLPSLKKGGHRVLIFSQWTSMLDILEWTLDVIGVTYRRLDGSTQVTERQAIVDAFNNDTSIFACLLSTRAGGQGLNLTGADTVVIHDMDFNPQIDRQAEDRCHRIGQTRPVTIYRLVTKGTVDENVYEIAKRKLILDAAVLESGVEVDNEGDTSDMTMGEILSSILMG